MKSYIKYILTLIGIIVLVELFLALTASASTFPLLVQQGGTGVNTITGILQGNGTSAISPITIGSGLSFSGGTLSASGGGTVTNVATDSTLTGGTITTTGTLGLNLTNSNTWTGQQTFNTSAPIIGTATASTIAGFDASKNLITLATATYPSLTELSYVKGVTSAIQTQINAKGAGTVTAVSVATANGVSGSSSGGATPALTISLGAITPTTVNGLTLASQAIGFTIAGGTTSKTLTVPLDASVSGTNTGDNATNSTYTTLANILSGTNTFTGQQTFNTSAPIIGTATASTIAGFDASKNLITLATATYPSLTELSYVKGLTSSAQTQLTAAATKTGSNWTFASQAIGDLPYASSTTAYTRLAAVAKGSVLISEGTGTAPAWSTTPAVANMIEGFRTQATAAGTTTLVVGDAYQQYFTGTTTQTVLLPTTGIVAGQQYQIVNQSTGIVTVQSSGANTILAVPANTTATFTALVATPTTAANWAFSSYPNTSRSSNAIVSATNQLISSYINNTTSFTALGISTSITTSGGRILVNFGCLASVLGHQLSFDVFLDGVDQGTFMYQNSTTPSWSSGWTILTGVSSASHTVDIRAKIQVVGDTGTIPAYSSITLMTQEI